MNKPDLFVVGLTGGIASGKSTAANYFRDLGVTVIDADQIARNVVEPDQPAYLSIVDRYGADILNKDKTLDRDKLRNIIFPDGSPNNNEKKWLESVTHPAIRDEMFRQLNLPSKKQETSYRILEVPLLMENLEHYPVDRILLIDSEHEDQIQRGSERDDKTAEQIQSIINAQMPRNEKKELAHDIIINNSTLEHLKQAISDLNIYYNELAEEKISNSK